MIQYPAPQRLIHIFAYSEGLQPVPGDALARQSCSYDTEQNRKALSWAYTSAKAADPWNLLQLNRRRANTPRVSGVGLSKICGRG